MKQSDIQSTIDSTYRLYSRRVFASLVRRLGDFDLAEDALHDAFKAAIEQWPTAGVPANPVNWLISTGVFKGIDVIRRQSRFDSLGERIDEVMALPAPMPPDQDSETVEDERLRLIFTCNHPAISADAQVALTLREVCGLSTEEIAKSFLTPTPTIAQRIVRAKAKIREAKIPFALPEPEDLPSRLSNVLKVIYLVFNAGYSTYSGERLHKSDLAAEAIRLARLVDELLPAAEVDGLLALMLLHDARSDSRATEDGDIIPLDEQDRALWDRSLIAEGIALVEKSLRSRAFGPYTLQAAISAVHCEAPSYADTDWSEIVGLYEALFRQQPSAVVALNLAVAIAMLHGPAAAISRVDALVETGELQSYHLAHAARADLYHRMGDTDRAKQSYQAALALTQQGPERRFLERKISSLTN